MMRAIIAPVEVEAIWSTGDPERGGLVVDSPIDFSRLPRRGRDGDVHPDRAPIGEELVLAPFEPAGLLLGAGVHLHWHIPVSLTRITHAQSLPGSSAASSRTVRDAPNRWLVTRQMGESTRRWIVESDYIHDAANAHDGVPYPMTRPSGEIEVRALGRVVDFDDWDPSRDEERRYLPHLTAFGSGEPTFASYYPSCRTVFGLYDDLGSPSGIDLTYTVIGWYRRPDQDPIVALLADLGRDDDPKDAIKEHLAWVADLPSGDGSAQMFCFGRVDVASSAVRALPTVTHVAIGHSGPEAAAALLASTTPDQSQRDIVEKQLEAALLEDELHDKMLDATARYHAARHRRGFIALPGERRWEIRVEADPSHPSDAEAVHATQLLPIPDGLAYGVGLLNGSERDLARAVAARDSCSRRLFDDWYRYLVASYPAEGSGSDTIDTDRVRHFLERRSLIGLERRTREVETATSQRDRHQADVVALLDAHNDATSALASATQSTNRRLALQPVQGPRFWLPREPVVVLGTGTPPPTSHLADNTALDCAVVSFDDGTPLRVVLDALHTDLLTTTASRAATAPQPLFLEWRAEFRPDAIDSSDVVDTYLLGPGPDTDARQTEPDLYRRPTASSSASSHPHSGRSIVGGSAGRHLSNQIVDRLTSVVDDFLVDHPALAVADPTGDPKLDARRLLSDADRLAAFTAWYGERWQGLTTSERLRDASHRTLVDGLDTLAGVQTISQVLDGLNAGLLAHRQSYQLPIMDPLAFDAYDGLVDRVAKATAGNTSLAPLPEAHFSPLRAGSVALSELRLIDSFGQFTDVPLDAGAVSTVVAESMREAQRSDAVLTPRLLQPARLHLRWLSAHHDDHDACGTGKTSPICGWVLPNELDGTLVVYSEEGVALGSISDDGIWRPSLDRPARSIGESIENAHLRRVVTWIVNHHAFATLHSEIVGALEKIEPEASAQHQALSLLMGRPIAVVRVEVALELQGPPASDPSWESFRREVVDGAPPLTGGIEQLRFPVRIGDHHQVNDGVIGYWREDGTGGIVDNLFHTTQSANTPMNLSLDSVPERITLLLDPRGSVHATCGILPTKHISVPHEQFDDALRHLSVTFETSPLLTPNGAIQLPLPTEPGHEWSWLERTLDGWNTTPASAITQPSATPLFVRSQQIREGWLRLAPSDAKDGGRS